MIKINMVCFGNHSGYSQAAQDMIYALHESGKYDVRIHYLLAHGLPHAGMTRDRQILFKKLAEKDKTEDRIQVYHCIPPAQLNAPRYKRNIGYAMFETFQPPNDGAWGWTKILNTNDAVIAPSLFNYRIFAHEKINKPVFYIPCCYDTGSFNQNVEPSESYDKFTFLFFGSWRQRKGYPQLIEAYLREFSSKDHVQLVIKTDKPHQAETFIHQLKNNLGLTKKDIAPILFENRILDEYSLPRFMKSANCLISPTLGEGFGLPGLQCMALGVPVAITDFSGCKDYANEETCTLIKPSGFVLHKDLDNIPQYKSKKWAHVTVSEVRRVMRSVLENKAEIYTKADKAARFVEQEFCYKKAEQMFSDVIRTVFNV